MSNKEEKPAGEGGQIPMEERVKVEVTVTGEKTQERLRTVLSGEEAEEVLGMLDHFAGH